MLLTAGPTFTVASQNSIDISIIKPDKMPGERSPLLFVLLDQNGGILGYYTLSSYSVRLGELTETTAKKLPRYPLLPATLLGRLAISSSCRGRNLGRFLLMDALHRSWRNTSEVASVGVVVEALDEIARAFYLHHEFTSLRDHPDRLFLAMATIEKAFKPR